MHLRGWKLPKGLTTPRMTVVECGGMAYLVVPEKALVVSLEAACERIDEHTEDDQ